LDKFKLYADSNDFVNKKSAEIKRGKAGRAAREPALAGYRTNPKKEK